MKLWRRWKRKTKEPERDPLDAKLPLGNHPIIARKDILDPYQKP